MVQENCFGFIFFDVMATFSYQHMFLWHLFGLWSNFTIYFVQDNLVRPVCGNLGFTSPCFAQL